MKEGDPQFMRRAIELAEEGMNGNFGGPFGAVVVRNGIIVSEGFNRVTSTPDPTAHGETVAIRKAAQELGVPWLEGCDLYTSCEPCPKCLGEALWAHIEKIYYAGTRADAAAIGFDDARFYEIFDVKKDQRIIHLHRMMRDEAWEVMQKWLTKKDKEEY
jgi:tRNA(Arg) A34 adenosine deaminase TadA